MIVGFINQKGIDTTPDKASIIEMFFLFAQSELMREAEELTFSEGLNKEAAKRYIETSLKHEYASENGTALNEVLPKMSPLNPNYLIKNRVFYKKYLYLLRNLKVLEKIHSFFSYLPNMPSYIQRYNVAKNEKTYGRIFTIRPYVFSFYS